MVKAHRDPDQYDRIEMMDDFFTRRYKVPLVKGPEDLDAFAHLLKAPTGGYRDLWIRNALKAKAIAQELGLATQARRVSIGDWFMWVCWIEDFCVQMMENPGYAERFYDIVQNYNRQILDMVLEVQPDIVQYRGWYDTPDYWGPKRLRAILAPRIQELAAQAHAGGSLFCYLLTEGYTVYRNILDGYGRGRIPGVGTARRTQKRELCGSQGSIGRSPQYLGRGKRAGDSGHGLGRGD